MIKRRLCFLLAFGITYCGFIVAGAAKTLEPKPTSFIVAQNSSIEAADSDTIEAIRLSYDALMQAGYTADKDRDYVTALKYFRQALNLRPNDSWANKAIKNITTYAFDRYMQVGYKADLNRDYQNALTNFQKALEINPNSPYAQQAVTNISQYLAVNSQESGNNQEGDSFNLLWIIIAIAGTGGISAILLFFLFQKTNSINLESAVKAPKDQDLINSATPTVLNPPYGNTNQGTEEDDLKFAEDETIITPLPTEESQPESEAKEVPPPQAEENQSQEIVATSSQISRLDIVPELIKDLEKTERNVRQKTIWELAQMGDSRAMQPLVELMIKVDSQERGLILEAMTQIASRTLKPMNKALMMTLEDENSRVKQNAIRDLTRVYELMNQVTKRLSQAVEDSDEEVQKTAEWALKKLNKMPQVPFWQNHNMSENNQDVSSN
ncbi:MAG: hypothetical protein QNJ32_23690 [Xenococcaceae cyanobacterium MO_167.B27]|nr:hypothetical protein [Xenococcaceae cyanobacterium MO_167.B27]